MVALVLRKPGGIRWSRWDWCTLCVIQGPDIMPTNKTVGNLNRAAQVGQLPFDWLSRVLSETTIRISSHSP